MEPQEEFQGYLKGKHFTGFFLPLKPVELTQEHIEREREKIIKNANTDAYTHRNLFYDSVKIFNWRKNNELFNK